MPNGRTAACALVLVLSAGCATAPGSRPDQGSAHELPAPEARLDVALTPYLNNRPARLLGFTDSGQALIATRFAQSAQLHRVAMPMGAREQLTFDRDAVLWAAQGIGADGPVLIYQQDRDGREAYQLYLLDEARARTSRLTDGVSRNDRPVLSPDRRWLAYASTAGNGTDFSVFAVDLATGGGTPRQVFGGAGIWYPLAFSPDGKQLLVQHYRSITDSEIWEVDVASGEGRNLVPSEAPAAWAMAIFDPQGKGHYLLGDRGGEWQRLWFRDAAGTLTLVGEDEPMWDVEDFAISPDGSRIARVINRYGTSNLYVHERSPWTEIGRLTLDHGVIGDLAFTPDGGAVGFTLGGPKTPGDVFTLEVPTQLLQRWTFGEVGGLNRHAFTEPELRHFGTFDEGIFGLDRQIPFYWYRPEGKGPFPVLVIVHGGPEVQARAGFDAFTQFLVRELKIAVAVPNVRGSAGYGRSALMADDGYRRLDAVTDLEYLIGWLQAQPEVDGRRIVVSGGSYGGFMALAAATRFGKAIAGAVSTVGISHFVTFLENTADYRRDQRRREYGDERDPEMRAFLHEISPLTLADRIEAPLLVMQGANDPRVPASEAEQIVAAARARGVPTWYHSVGDEGHGFRRLDSRRRGLMLTVQFLERFVLPGRTDGGPERLER